MYQSTKPATYGTCYNPDIQQNYGYMQSLTSNNKDKETISATMIEEHQNEEKNVEAFLLMVQEANEFTEMKPAHRSSKIGIAKDSLSSALELNKELESICIELEKNKNLSEEIWKKNVAACNKLKAEVSELLKPFQDPQFLHELKKDVEKRKKKRLRDKVKKEKWRNEKQMREERCTRLHAEIDSWIRKEQAVIEKEKQDENLHREADMILSDVRGKRNDTRKYLGLLKELKHLRNVKANIAKARGEHLSLAADEAFNSIIDKLTEQWLDLDREYSMEEQGLKLMLKTDNENRIEKQKKNAFDDWENLLFGRKILDQLSPDMNRFVAIRCAWDKYISSDYDATPIPIGWVLPDEPSSAAWQKCLAKDIS